MERGLIQVYTGDGKGKTTAAIGQALRAIGRGYKVYMVQFLKGGDSGELHAVKRLEPDFKIYRFEKNRGFFWTLSEEEKRELKKEIDDAFEFVKKVVETNDCDILILDEIMGVIQNGLLTVKQVLEVLERKPATMEIILTGRNVPKEIEEKAELVTEMKMIKHPFQKGIGGRLGIEY